MNKLAKNVKKFDKLIEKNKDEIKEILMSESFIKQLIQEAYINVQLTEDEDLLIHNIPIKLSHFITSGCILMLKNNEFIVLKGI